MPQPDYIHFDEMPFEEMNDKVYRRYVHGQKAMLVYFKLKKGAVIPEHHHVNEQITYILSGTVRIFCAGKEYIVKKGEVLIIPSNAPHKFEALEDTVDMDVFCPPREDWLKGTDNYTERDSKIGF